jgi:hypothetical protein
MWVLLLVAASLGLSSAGHDHSQHINQRFILGEARRIAWHSLEDIQRNIKDYTQAIRFIETKHEEYFNVPNKDDQVRLERVWKETFETNYRETYDRLLIISQVCSDLYNENPI